jgi:Arc/MetJ family transcription regulator
MSVTIDDELIERAREALGTDTRAETIRSALEEAVRRRRLERALAHEGAIALDVGQEELQRLRAEG